MAEMEQRIFMLYKNKGIEGCSKEVKRRNFLKQKLSKYEYIF